jgi:hypothetical protein
MCFGHLVFAKNTENCFLQVIFRYTIVFYVNSPVYLRVFFASALIRCCQELSSRCAQQGGKSKIVSALRARDTRENG